jgi:hypothetical protein
MALKRAGAIKMPITESGKTKYRPYAHKSLHKISQAENSAVEELTDLDNEGNDPPPTLIFPPIEMQQPQHFKKRQPPSTRKPKRK